MNTIFTEHTVNNTDNNAKPKTKKKMLQQDKTGTIPYNLLY